MFSHNKTTTSYSEESPHIAAVVVLTAVVHVRVAAVEVQVNCAAAGVLRRGPPTVANRKHKSLNP